MSNDKTQPTNNQFILYQDDNGAPNVNGRFDGQDGWLSQQQIALLFDTTQQNISLHINSIVDEGELQKEATQNETQTFLGNDFIQLANEYSADSVKTMNRKRIAIAKETLRHFTPQEKKNMFGYIREYCGDLSFDGNAEQFSISNEEDLKKLLYGIEQRYYTTRIGNEKRLANSILTLE